MNKGHEVAAVVGRAKEDGATKVKPKHYSDGSEKTPGKTSGWRKAKDFLPHLLGPAISVSGWRRGDVFVVSALELAEAPDGRGDSIPQWHLSVSVRTGDDANPARRATDAELRAVVASFWLTGAEEDNHHPGVARHIWMPVDPKRRVDCECKATETVVVEPDGYKYSEQIGTCAGCELEVATAGATKCLRHVKIGIGTSTLSDLIGQPRDASVRELCEDPRSRRISERDMAVARLELQRALDLGEPDGEP